MIIKLFLSVILLNFGFNNFGSFEQSKCKIITVFGKAFEDKDGAIVLTRNGSYFIDGLDNWGKKYYGKKIKVSGKLIFETHQQQSTDSIPVQERVGTIRVIKNAKWVLVK